VVFQADNDKTELQKINYDVIFVTSSPLRHRKIVIKITTQNFSILPLPQSKFLATLVCWTVPVKNEQMEHGLGALREVQMRSRGANSRSN